MDRSHDWDTRPAESTPSEFVRPGLDCSLRNAAVFIVALALMLAVTTRFTNYANIGTHLTGPTVHQNLESKRQHIEKTSFVRMAGLADLVRLRPPAVSPVVTVDVPVIKALFGEHLYNRPPPLFS